MSEARILSDAAKGEPADHFTKAPASLGFDGQSEAVRQLRDGLDSSLSEFGLHVLVGEQGSGRTRAARYLWRHSARPGRFVPIIDRLSLEEAVHGDGVSCLFINEIGMTEPALQTGLLQLLERRPAAERPALICTSSWTPARLVQDRRVGETFGAMLAPHCVAVPPARDRREDLTALCAVWMGQADTGLALHDDTVPWLAKQDWPGNFRQIRQLLHHASEGRRGNIVTAARLAELHRVDATPDAASFQGLMARYLPSMLDLETDVQGSLHARVLAEVERPLFRLVLRATDGNQIRAAALLGINRNTLRKRLQLLGIETGRSRS
ncbi:helix-turn-helix domain-containing protein [Asaia krungthepensis]|uniref:Two component response regulator n=1 Tax=Asaia krungthepensis NRIC 0535 TaxID=1307925 RepID=A0ABQ0Q1D1_9PROT|nr:helix-turn-helix domain-containing protein [Asaia krungthepensis]GBQ86711.1 two component response regulator [Asaia krungthepensis NRIC 0535]